MVLWAIAPAWFWGKTPLYKKVLWEEIPNNMDALSASGLAMNCRAPNICGASLVACVRADARVLRRTGMPCGVQPLKRIDQWMAENARDTNPDVQSIGRKRARARTYYFKENYEEGMPS